VGDELLRRIAERLRGVAGKNYPVSRFGGDEFVILLPELRCKEEASALAGIIIDSLKETFRVNGHDIVVGASIGVSTTINGIANTDILLRNADLALYRAKAESKGSVQFYEPEMGLQMEARLGMECDLRMAVKSQELSLNFQPLVSVDTKRVTTCEALIRWRHPVLGSISPAKFIPVAEEMGLIVEIGDWVLNKACEECCKWPDNIRVAVNLSALQFKRGDIFKSVITALERSGLPANRLELEITESVMLQDIDEVRQTLEELQKFGVRISLDDFGTGYSSLSYLHSLPLHKVKIDRSFIQDINTDEKSLTLCKNIAQMGRQLGLSIVVEGVETQEQLDIVTENICADEIQGFLFSPPLSATNILEMVLATNGKTSSSSFQITKAKASGATD
jgi:predicted signal transduction protein with EAL and GGDEF domain